MDVCTLQMDDCATLINESAVLTSSCVKWRVKETAANDDVFDAARCEIVPESAERFLPPERRIVAARPAPEFRISPVWQHLRRSYPSLQSSRLALQSDICRARRGGSDPRLLRSHCSRVGAHPTLLGSHCNQIFATALVLAHIVKAAGAIVFVWQRAAPPVALAAAPVTLAASPWRAIAARGTPAAGAVTVAATAVTLVAVPWTPAAGPWKVIYRAQMLAAVTRTLISRAWRLLHALWRHPQSG